MCDCTQYMTIYIKDEEQVSDTPGKRLQVSWGFNPIMNM